MSRYHDQILEQEESIQLLHQLIQLSRKSQISWQCTHYVPITLIPEENENGDETSAAIVHNIILQAEYNAKLFIAEIFEKLSIPSGNPFTRLDLTVLHESNHTEVHYDSFPKAEREQFIGTIIRHVEDSPEVNEEYQRSHYDTLSISPHFHDHPLTILGRNLFQQKAVFNFHRIVVDKKFRRTLLTILHNK